MRKIIGLLFLLILFTSAVPSMALPNKTRPAISKDDVKEYKGMPPNAERIGTVSTSVFSYFGGAEAKRDLRKQAAAAGANGFTIIEKKASGSGMDAFGKPAAKSYEVTAEIFYVDTYTSSSVESSTTSSKIGVIPFSPMDIDEDECEFIAKMISKKLSADKMVVDHEDMMDALDDVDCDDEEDWNRKSCVKEVGDELNADYILAGSIGKIGNAIVAEVTLYDLTTSESVLSKQYSSEGSIESFALSNPNIIAEDVAAALEKRVTVSKVEQVQEPVVAEEKPEPVKSEPKKVSFPTIDNGIVKGATIGVKGLFALGKIVESQSPAGFGIMFLYPTGEETHFRFRGGIPSWHSQNNSMTKGKDYPDPYITLEHAWGWKSFGFSAGLAYMHMQRFTGITEINSGMPYTFKYDPFNAFNAVISLRGGRTIGGFHGMISFPLAFTIDRENLNYVIEYCIGGVFGAKKTKVGIGSSGMFKRRYADEATVISGNTVTTIDIEDYNDSYFRRDHMVREFYCLLPHIKFAQLFGDHIVASLTLDLGGVIIPRPESKESWKPSLGCDFIFSFGKLDGPNLYDGTF